MMKKRSAGYLGSLDDFVHLGVMKSSSQTSARFTQNSIACLDCGVVWRSSYNLQNKQSDWYAFMLVTLLRECKWLATARPEQIATGDETGSVPLIVKP